MDISDALKKAHVFLGQQGLYATEFIFMSCGDFDGNLLGREAEAKQLFIPNYLKRWINLKKVFPKHIFDPNRVERDFTACKTIRNCKPQISGMEQMLNTVGLQFEGRHHSGIDDCNNLARVVINLLERGF